MPTLDLGRWDPSSREEERLDEEISTESFDRLAFTQRALELVRPKQMTIAVCEGSRRLRVEAGRLWGKGEGERWAMVCVPKTASRRAIAIAVVQLAGAPADPYVLDVLLGDRREPYRSA
jgi:hypothetical protein